MGNDFDGLHQALESRFRSDSQKLKISIKTIFCRRNFDFD